MKQATISIEEVRRAGVTHPITSRSYATWAKYLRPLLEAKGIPEDCIALGRNGVHIQGTDAGYLLTFHETADNPARTAADRTAAAAVLEQQGKDLARKTAKKRSANA